MIRNDVGRAINIDTSLGGMTSRSISHGATATTATTATTTGTSAATFGVADFNASCKCLNIFLNETQQLDVRAARRRSSVLLTNAHDDIR